VVRAERHGRRRGRRRRHVGLGTRDQRVRRRRARRAIYVPAAAPSPIVTRSDAEVACARRPRAAEARGAPARSRRHAPQRARPGSQHALHLRRAAARRPDRRAPAGGRGAHARRPFVQLSAAQARHRVAADETQLEETYYHRLNPPQGFAFQRVYTDDRSLDEACAVEDGTTS
jgi:5-deoxy-glucuronate isomerase